MTKKILTFCLYATLICIVWRQHTTHVKAIIVQQEKDKVNVVINMVQEDFLIRFYEASQPYIPENSKCSYVHDIENWRSGKYKKRDLVLLHIMFEIISHDMFSHAYETIGIDKHIDEIYLYLQNNTVRTELFDIYILNIRISNCRNKEVTKDLILELYACIDEIKEILDTLS